MKKHLLFAAGISFLSGPLMAQQKTLPLNEVVVTANKFDQKASQTGKVVTVITQKDLEHQSGETLGQVLNQQAGLTVNGSSGPLGTNQNIYLRGADPQYTLIMINGIPVSDISQINSYFDINLIPVSDIERIEIMKGGYASVYGSGAAAGVINIITKKGGAKPFQASLRLQAGSYNTYKENLSLHGRKNKIDYSVRFGNEDSKGFSSALDTTGKQGFDKDGYHRRSVFANLGYHPDAHWVLRPFIRYTYQKGGLDADVYTDDKDYYYTSGYFQTGISIRHTFQHGDLTFRYHFNPIERHYDNDTADRAGFIKEDYKSRVHVADVYLHYDIHDRFSFLIGNTLRLEKTDQQTQNDFGKTTLSSDSAKADAMSIYGSVFYHAPAGLNIELGGRLNQHKSYGFHPVFSFNPSWMIKNRIKIFANVASSYTSPSLYQLYSAYGNADLKPETGKSYEAGIEAWFAHQKIDLSLTAFHRRSKDLIAFANLHYINYDRQKESGGETILTYNITDKLKLSAYYAYVTGEVTVHNAIAGKDSSYNNLFKRPKSSLGATLGYQILPQLYVSLRGKYTGNRQDLFFYPIDPVTYVQRIRELKAYYLLDFYAQYKFKNRYHAFIALNNITDSKYTETTGFATRRFNFNAGVRIDLF